MRSIKLFAILTILFSSIIFAKAIGPNTFYSTIKNHKVVIVKFWAPWCPPCKILTPKFEKAKHIVGNKALFATYNIDLRGEPLNRYKIEMIPTMVLFVNGKEVDRNNSPMLTAQEIADWVMSYTN